MLNTLYLPEIREMIAEQDHAGLAEFCTTLHAASTAEYMEGLTPGEAWEVLKHSDVGTRVEIFRYFSRGKQVAMLETLDRAEMANFIGDLPSDERVDILDEVDAAVVAELLPLLPSQERHDILRLQAYEEGTAGSVMTTDLARLQEDFTLEQARRRLKKWAETPESLETLYYLYVVDSEDHLLGVVSFRDLTMGMLLYDNDEKRVGDLIERNVIAVEAHEPRGEVARIFARYDLLALPVVDEQRRLLGIVTHDDVIDLVREEATREAQRIAAVEPLEENFLSISLWSLAWKRGLWLIILFFASLLTATALDGYQHVTQMHLWLIMFIPMIISTGGNTGSQSATLVITALANGDVQDRQWLRVLRRELVMGLSLGSILGTLGYIVASMTLHSLYQALVIPLTVLLVVLSGTLIGGSLPLIFRRLGWDPALMSNPLVACISDILGVLIYMNVALLLL